MHMVGKCHKIMYLDIVQIHYKESSTKEFLKSIASAECKGFKEV